MIHHSVLVQPMSLLFLRPLYVTHWPFLLALPLGRCLLYRLRNFPACHPPLLYVILIFRSQLFSTRFSMLTDTYHETVHWRKNLFTVPYGKSGKQFFPEIARLVKACAERSCLESIPHSAVSVACVLLLQRPHPRSKPNDHSDCVSRHMKQWNNGRIDQLLLEGCTIQKDYLR